MKNALPLSPLIQIFIRVISELGVEVKIIQEEVHIYSRGASHLFPPTMEIDVEGEENLVYAFCGFLCCYDYIAFFVDSSKNLAAKSFSALVLGFYEMGTRFSYSPNFSLPIQIKGTSNLLPMKHNILTDNFGLHLGFALAGLSGMGKTSLISSSKLLPLFYKLLNLLKANVSLHTLEDQSFELILTLENSYQEAVIDINQIDKL